MVPVIVRVYGDDGDGAPSTDVPVTPDTTWRDVIECCRDPGDEDCELVGIWAGRCEKALREGDRPLEILQRWGSGRDSVKLMLRYTPLSSEAPPATPNNNNGGRINSRNGMKEPGYLEETLPDGVQLTLGELREMAHRQQHQIDAQHQLLAAKEQRLRHLKEQEARHQRVATENERLRRLRDRVEAQELKLRKLRALRGQVDQNKQNNVLLTSDLDSIRALFNEKEKELSVAVAKVDELTRQLEELRRGRASRDQPPSAATLELDKLRRELMYRNKLNEQQNARLHQQREALTQRQEEMSNIDKRILELQDRLQRKRIMNQQLDTQLTTVPSKGGPLHGSQSGSAQIVHHPLTKQYSKGNVAAIEPYNHVPLMNHNDDKSSSVDKRLITGSAYYPSSVTNQSKNISDFNNLKNQNKEDYQGLKNKQSNSNIQKNDMNNDYITEFGASKSDPKYQTLPYNTKFSVNFMTTKTNRENSTDSEKLSADNVETPQSNGSKSTAHQHMMVHSTPLSTVNKSLAIPLSQNDVGQEKQAAQKANDQKNGDIGSRLSGPGRGQPVGEPSNNLSTPTNVNFQKPISSVAPTSIHHASNKPSPIYQTSSTKIQPVQPQIIKASVQTSTPSSQAVGNQVVVLSPPNSSSTPITSPEVNSDKNKPVLPPKPAIKPPPRQMQPSATDYEPKDGSEASVPPIPKSDPPLDSPPIHRYDNKPIKARPLTIKKQPLSEQPKLRNVSKLNGVHVSINRRIEMPPAFLFPEMETPPSDLINNENNSSTGNKQIADNNNDSKNATRSTDEVDKSATSEEKNVVAELDRENKKNACESSSNDNKIDNVVRRVNKGNLKQSGKVNLSRRVSFDPLALLLDASLEGELELVKKTATQVANPSAANDEGITALHNAICAGHLEIVKFLVEFGCDVNAQDSDGWTPLHCAASCNNVAMVRFLVEHGACIFATTLSDHETAAEKCEEDEEGFDGCSEYLYSVQEKLGILYGGIVYAVFDYMAQQPDELSFTAGQQLTVIRKGDENEREWWWARLGDREGYVPRNLLGLYPRVASKSE